MSSSSSSRSSSGQAQEAVDRLLLKSCTGDKWAALIDVISRGAFHTAEAAYVVTAPLPLQARASAYRAWQARTTCWARSASPACRRRSSSRWWRGRCCAPQYARLCLTPSSQYQDLQEKNREVLNVFCLQLNKTVRFFLTHRRQCVTAVPGGRGAREDDGLWAPARGEQAPQRRRKKHSLQRQRAERDSDMHRYHLHAAPGLETYRGFLAQHQLHKHAKALREQAAAGDCPDPRVELHDQQHSRQRRRGRPLGLREDVAQRRGCALQALPLALRYASTAHYLSRHCAIAYIPFTPDKHFPSVCTRSRASMVKDVIGEHHIPPRPNRSRPAR